jgi:hypothetical protein
MFACVIANMFVWPELKDLRERELSWQLGVRERVEINISKKEHKNSNYLNHPKHIVKKLRILYIDISFGVHQLPNILCLEKTFCFLS